MTCFSSDDKDAAPYTASPLGAKEHEDPESLIVQGKSVDELSKLKKSLAERRNGCVFILYRHADNFDNTIKVSSDAEVSVRLHYITGERPD